jgi:hypothetical protein
MRRDRGKTTAMADVRLFADERVVWREQSPGNASGIMWDEIYRVCGQKIGGATEAYTIVELDFECGEFMELIKQGAGFNEVAAAITARLPGIDPNWFQKVERLGVVDSPIELWRRRI